MSEESKIRGQKAALARALLLDPTRITGPREPQSPQPLKRLLAGGEWTGWDVRRDIPIRADDFLAFEGYSARTRRRVADLIIGIDVKRLRDAERALTAEGKSDRIPNDRIQECWALARICVLARAELGDAEACLIASGMALSQARDSFVTGDLGGWLYLRTALFFAYRGRVDSRDIEYVPEPRYSDLTMEDALLGSISTLLGLAREGQAMVEVEEDILRGGAGAQGSSDLPPALPADDFDPLDLGDKPEPAVSALGIVVFPKVDHLPKPSPSARDRGDSPRALVEDLARRRIPLVPAPDPAQFRSKFLAAVPWAAEAADIYAHDLVGAPYAAFRPRILVGPPGEGKTAAARLLASLAGLDVTVFGAAGVTDGGAFAGTNRQWGTWRLSTPAQAILRARRANTAVIVDEIEKATDQRRWGRLDETLLPYLERHTARAIHDPALEAPVDVSAVSYIVTANSLDGVSAPLIDRCQVVRWKGPRREDMAFLARAFVRDIRTERGLDEAWLPDLDGDELDALDWWPGGSMRPLRRAVETILASRDAYTPRH